MKKPVKILLLSGLLLTFMLTKTINVMQDTKEVWKDAVNYEGLYKISNYGNAHSLITNTSLRLILDSRGYFRINMHKNKEQKLLLIHRLVAIAFIPNPENKPQVNHRDGNKTNNKVDNLEWATSKENCIHAYATGLQKPSDTQKRIVSNHCKDNYSKKVFQFDPQGNIIAEYYSASEAGRITGLSQTYISMICRGAFNSKKYIFKYA